MVDLQTAMDGEVLALVAAGCVVCCELCIGRVVADLIPSVPSIVPAHQAGHKYFVYNAHSAS